MISLILTAWAALATAAISPGPNLVAVASRGLGSGRNSALTVALFGGAYLLWLGFKGWRAALTGKGGQIAPVTGRGVRQDFLHGLTVTSTNPKVALLWASLSTFVGPAITDWPLLLTFTTGSAIIIFVIYGTFGWLFSTGRARGLYQQFQKTSEALFGTLFGGLGIFMINGAL